METRSGIVNHPATARQLEDLATREAVGLDQKVEPLVGNRPVQLRAKLDERARAREHDRALGHERERNLDEVSDRERGRLLQRLVALAGVYLLEVGKAGLVPRGAVVRLSDDRLGRLERLRLRGKGVV